MRLAVSLVWTQRISQIEGSPCVGLERSILGLAATFEALNVTSLAPIVQLSRRLLPISVCACDTETPPELPYVANAMGRIHFGGTLQGVELTTLVRSANGENFRRWHGLMVDTSGECK